MRSMGRAARVALRMAALLAVSITSAGWGRPAPVSAGSVPTPSASATLAWHSIPPMRTGRYDSGAEWYGGTIVLIGGFDAHGTAMHSVESYDLDYNRWTTAPPMPTARGEFGMTTQGYNTPITVLGGADSHGRPLNVVEEYDPPGMGQHPNRWSRLPAMPQPRRGLAAAFVPAGPEDLMVAGGIGRGGTVLGSVLGLTVNLPKHGDYTWRPLAPMHTPRSDFALVWGGNLSSGSALAYAIGGFGPGHTALRSVEAYNARTNRWTLAAPMPVARGGLAAQPSDGGRLITAAGGFDGRGHALTTVEQYNVATNTWTTLPSMPVARGGLSLVDTEGASRPGLFALGGQGATGAVLASAAAREASLPRTWSLDTPLPQKRGTVVAARGADGLIYAFGSGPRIDVFTPPTHRWSVRTPGHATAASSQSNPVELIYTVSGRAFEAYDPRTNRWIERAPLPVERYDAAVVPGKDGKVYVLGGYGPDPGDNSNRLYRRGLEVYDPRTNTWQVKAQMPTAREGLGAAVGTDGTIYAIGGGTDQYDRFYSCTSVVEAYHPRTNMWSRMPRLPVPMCGVTSGTTASGTIVAVGGPTVQGGEQSSRITATGRLVAFKPGAHSWSVLAQAPYPRKHAGAVVEPDGAVYLIGGADGLGDATATVQKYTPRGTG